MTPSQAKRSVPVLLVLLSPIAAEANAAPAGEGKALSILSWESQPLLSGERSEDVSAPGSSSVWKIMRPQGSQDTIPITAIEGLGISQPNHFLRGHIRYEQVGAPGFLEMWTHYADGSRFFTRTLADTGPMAPLVGTSGWRPILLPFEGDIEKHPVKLELNLVLPGGGTVWLSEVSVGEYGSANGFTESDEQWWGQRSSGLIGGAVGSLFGLGGALVGCLVGTGRARRFVLTSIVLGALAGIVLLGIGMIALADGQPYPVWYPLVLSGTFGLLFGALFPAVRNRYISLELRRMAAADIP